MLVFARETSAEDCESHWLGGPEFAIEIVSPGDRTLEKIDFYAKVGTQELLVIDREPWQLTLYGIGNQATTDVARRLRPVAINSLTQSDLIQLQTFPLAFQLKSNPSAVIEVMHANGDPIRRIPIQLRHAKDKN